MYTQRRTNSRPRWECVGVQKYTYLIKHRIRHVPNRMRVFQPVAKQATEGAESESHALV